MSTIENTIPEVFRNISLPQSILKKLGNVVVTSVVLEKEAQSLIVGLLSKEIIPSRYIHVLKEELSASFAPVTNIELRIAYDIPAEDVKEKIELFWPNIIAEVQQLSPLCHRLLEDATKEYAEEGKLTIHVKNNSAFVFSKKGIDLFIHKQIQMYLSEEVRVVFEDVKLNATEKEENVAFLLKQESSLVRDTIAQIGEIKPTEKNAPYVQKKPTKEGFFSANGNAPRRANVKINHQLVQDLQKNQHFLSEGLEEATEILISGEIFEFELRETKAGRYLITFDITDQTNAITIKFFVQPDQFSDEMKGLLKKGKHIIVKGTVQNDDYSKELNVMAKELCPGVVPVARMDDAEEKRVELHLHTQMSAMDGISTAKSIVQTALKWGHKAVAITDHGVVQAFPEAMEAAKGKDIKIIYGVEAYFVDDLGAVVECPRKQPLDTTCVVFDLETTGLKKESDKIIEIGAVKIKEGKVVDTFNSFVDPGIRLPEKIIEITNITDAMLVGAPKIETVFPQFMEFIEDAVLVAHNASFDMGFVRTAAEAFSTEMNHTVLDTLELARTLLPELHNHKLGTLTKHFNVSLENHHRACDDAMATAEILFIFNDMLREKEVHNLDEINLLASSAIDKKKLKTYHGIILVENEIGLRNLYELVSMAHIQYFFRRPRMPKSQLTRLREGLIIGTACEAGELFQAILNKKPKEYLRQLADFYDYFEIQPIENNMFLLRNGTVNNVQELIDLNKEIVALGEKFDKPVVATCDVHFLNPSDDVYRRIIMFSEGFKDADLQAPLYYRTTEEMLNEFQYLGAEKAREVVIDNTNKIADQVKVIKPIPDETFPPRIEGAEEEIKKISIEKAQSIYGEPLPQIVADRLDRELTSIIKNGFSVMYIIAQKLVWKSLEDGYLVGSRGSVGSSFVATMLSITEVNALQPHYVCPNCKYADFESDVVKSYLGGSGCDMPDCDCPKCGTKMNKDGHDIPFETFLGFDGDKEPDIDLNFSGEYQAKAHAYTEELFGEGFVFKAGTIGTVAEKTAYGFVRKYADEKGMVVRNAEVNRLRNGCTGIKRTTGQHPGGLMIVPNDHSIYEFCPIQRPANDVNSTVVTTHFDYHSISGRLLKLDILGHDVPTIIRYLHDTTGVDPTTVDIGDAKVISLFTSPEALGVTAENINCKTGTLGLPEFGTSFVRQMLLDTQPNSFAELVRISGLSHGTDVWFNNAQDLIRDGVATLKEVIPTRDDIMVYLINKGVEKKAAFKIMENVRKGKGLTNDEEETMRAAHVTEWYIESCKRIKYMFPKGHAVAYVMMTVRIGYFKIYYPYSFYGASFSVKSEDFDYELMCQGMDKVRSEMKRIASLGKDATAKEKGTLTILELVLEMYARGLKFVPLDLYRSHATKFMVTQEGLLPPLCSIQGLGANAAQGIVTAREEGEFMTVEEFRDRTKTTKTVIEILKTFNILKGIPDTDQLSLF